jgi:hypothetical protein
MELWLLEHTDTATLFQAAFLLLFDRPLLGGLGPWSFSWHDDFLDFDDLHR